MNQGFQFKLDNRFKNRTRARFEKFQFEVGVLKDKAHRDPQSKKKGLTAVAGGPARKKKSKSSQSMQQVSKWLRMQTDYLRAPFKRRFSKQVRAFKNQLFQYLSRPAGKYHGVLFALEEIVRYPMRTNRYGSNARSTIKTKGFNRFSIDTGQLYQNIRARIVRRK